MNLYRGKRKDNQEWAYGDLISYGKERYILTSEELSKGIDIGGWLDGVQTYEVNAETVGRETDLKDKHGFSVFEGDMIMDKIHLLLFDMAITEQHWCILVIHFWDST